MKEFFLGLLVAVAVGLVTFVVQEVAISFSKEAVFFVGFVWGAIMITVTSFVSMKFFEV